MIINSLLDDYDECSIEKMQEKEEDLIEQAMLREDERKLGYIRNME